MNRRRLEEGCLVERAGYHEPLTNSSLARIQVRAGKIALSRTRIGRRMSDTDEDKARDGPCQAKDEIGNGINVSNSKQECARPDLGRI